MSIYKKIIILFASLLAIELLLRIIGFGSPLLYVEDKDYEYINAPNQNIFRFGSRIYTNELGIRNPKIKSDSFKILKVGDSIIHGGTQTSNSQLSTNILSNKLSEYFNQSIDVLNISAGSWGPDNGFEFIKKHGDFDASLIILVYSSHDYYDKMDFGKVVDIHPSYPSQNPPFAIYELIHRYLKVWIFDFLNIQRLNKNKINSNYLLINNSKEENPGWENFINYSIEKDIPLWVVLHPTKKELKTKEFNDRGKKIIELLNKNNIKLYNEIELGTKLEFYRDDIHYNSSGQKFLSEILYNDLITFVENQLEKKIE
jgi:hypothetical protein